MPTCNVLRVNEVEEATQYADAVRAVLLNIQRELDKTLVDIAEEIGVTVGTVSNWANRRGTPNAIFLQRLEKQYGIGTLNPIDALTGARRIPLSIAGTESALPALAALLNKLASVKNVIPNHQELLEMLPELSRVASAVVVLEQSALAMQSGRASK
jgi:transcriptional regulator with XRE-family HTH domain